MDHRLVDTSSQIIRSFSSHSISNVQSKKDQLNNNISKQHTSLGFNEIIDRTSKDRGYVKKVIDLLKKTDLLTMEGKWKQGKKQQIKLTILGAEILDILENIAQFNKSREDFMRSISGFTENLSAKLEQHPNEANIWKAGKDKQESYRALFNIGFNPDEVVQISNTQFIYLFVSHFMDVSIFLSLLQSYMHIFYTYYSQVSKNTEDLLIEIILHEMHEQIRILVKQPFYSVLEGEIQNFEHDVNQITATLFGSSIKLHIDEMIDATLYFDIPSSIVRQEIRKSLLSLLRIARFSPKTILGWQKSFRDKIERVEKIRSLSSEMKEKGNSLASQALEMDSIKVNMNNLRELDDICKKYLSGEKG